VRQVENRAESPTTFGPPDTPFVVSEGADTLVSAARQIRRRGLMLSLIRRAAYPLLLIGVIVFQSGFTRSWS
jgi:hypothetical protein